MNEKASEIKYLQFELTRRQNEESVEAFDSLKRLIKTLENENTTLKVGRFMLYLFIYIFIYFWWKYALFILWQLKKFLLSYHSK